MSEGTPRIAIAVNCQPIEVDPEMVLCEIPGYGPAQIPVALTELIEIPPAIDPHNRTGRVWMLDILTPSEGTRSNDRVHHYEAGKARKRQAQQTQLLALERGILKPPFERAVLQHIFRVDSKRRRDRDNAIASLKGALDGLAHAGVIEDDSGIFPLPVEWKPIGRKETKGATLILHELKPEAVI